MNPSVAGINTHTSTSFASKSGSIFTQTSTFHSFLQILPLTQEIQIKCKMKRSNLFCKSSTTFTTEEAFETLGSAQFIPPLCRGHQSPSFPIPKRGHVGCNTSGCLFKVPYSYSKKSGNKYMMKPGLYLTHDHPPIGMDLDGCTQVKNHVDLEPAEIESCIPSQFFAWVRHNSFTRERLLFPTPQTHGYCISR